MSKKRLAPTKDILQGYAAILDEVVQILEGARRAATWSVNSIMTATYWQVGRRIVAFEQEGRAKAEYGQRLIEQLAQDLTARFGRGFGRRNLFQMRKFFLSRRQIVQKLSAQSSRRRAGRKVQKLSAQLADGETLRRFFPLPWSHYVRLLWVKEAKARRFYEQEALRGGWTFRQLERQIVSKFYERTLLSRSKGAVLRDTDERLPEDAVTLEEELKDPFILEFLGLKDEFSESDLEEALILKLEDFLLELPLDVAG